MKCDACDNEATVHEVSITNGVKLEQHLCEACAAKHGLGTKSSLPMGAVIKAMASSSAHPQGVFSGARVGACPGCRTTFAEFKQHGLLGCPRCYEVFAAQLEPMLSRAHDGGVRHTGKVPGRAARVVSTAEEGNTQEDIMQVLEARRRRLEALRQELEEAVRNEQYELAAKLRDEMRRLQESGPSTGTKPSGG
ncbi:MAG: UvrB/UvrC motif-containing protein [Phycisphaerales bacterium]